jgi:peptidoglycan hydrolase CwlO-like protein
MVNGILKNNMAKADELEKNSATIHDANKRLAQVTKLVYDIDQEIVYLQNCIETLEENIKCLKKNRIIAMATEFKKAKNDLETARNRVGLLKKDRDTSVKALRHTELFIKKAIENYQNLLRSFNNNVVRGNFGSRNNGSR